MTPEQALAVALRIAYPWGILGRPGTGLGFEIRERFARAAREGSDGAARLRLLQRVTAA